jgi:hypothetical protein
MAKPKTRRPNATVATPFEEARDEMFQHIMSCGVIGSAPEDQVTWFSDTIRYMSERFPELSEGDLATLRQLGERFAQPPKAASAAPQLSVASVA